MNKLKKYYLSVSKPIACQDERSVPIKNLFVHPIRGIRALPVKYAFICPFGMKYDRELVLIDVDANAPVTSSSFLELANLTQQLIYDPPSIKITTTKP